MITSRWRREARPIIEAVLRAHQGEPEKQIRAALREAYPFGARQWHPYTVWRDEIARQRGTKRPQLRKQKPPPAPDPRQPGLFEGAPA